MPEIMTDVTREVPRPIGQVWPIDAAFGAEILWFPSVTASTLEGYGINSVRTNHFKENPWVDVAIERLDLCDGAAHHIRWQVQNKHLEGEIYSNIVLEDLEGKSTKIHWYAEGTPLADEVQRASMRACIEGIYNECIDSLAAKLGA